jgi:hypothetical protein
MSALGSVNWVASRCRTDVAFAAHYLSRFLAAPTVEHVHASAHLLRSLGHTRALGLRFSTIQQGRVTAGPTSGSLTVYRDATFTSDQADSSSVAGVVAYLSETPVYWHVSRISYVARCSTDLELWVCDDALQ